MAAAVLGLVALGFVVLARRRIHARERYDPREWSIGMLEGSSPLELEAGSRTNPVLTAREVTDVRAEFVADPFLMRHDSRWFLFFEVMEARTKLGSIAVAVSDDAQNFRYDRVVLRESFHLSYPFVFEADSTLYMVPETSKAAAVFLYRARKFPYEWEVEATLLTGKPYVDPTLFQHGGKWWMFTSTPTNDRLRLHMADALKGPWVEHPSSPIVRANPHIARPAGRVLNVDGRLLRFAQDCDPFYGKQIHGFEITCLDSETYKEIPVGRQPLLGPSGSGWNQDKMHNLDAHRLAPDRWIACVDGKGIVAR